MYKYKLPNGQTYTVSEKRREEFLSDHPDAVLITDDTSITPDESIVDDTEVVDMPDHEKLWVGDQQYTVHKDKLEDFKKKFKEDISWDKPRLVENKYNHITEAQYLDVADDSWFSREENMRKLLENQYKYDKNGNLSGIKFKERGMGNRIEVILPGNDSGRYFDLEGVGAGGGQQAGFLGIGGGSEYAKFKNDYVNLVEYIEDRTNQRLDGKSLGETTKTDIHKAFTNRPWHEGDDNVAEILTNLDLGEGYEFTAREMFNQAIEVKLPNDSKQLFYANYDGDEDGRNETAARIIRFIESNPRNYTHTEAYNKELNKINEVINPILDKYLLGDPSSLENIKTGRELLDDLASDKKIEYISKKGQITTPSGKELGKKIISEKEYNNLSSKEKEKYEIHKKEAKGPNLINTLTSQNDIKKVKKALRKELNLGGFFKDNRTFKDLTSDQQDRLIENRVSDLVDEAFKINKHTYAKTEANQLMESGIVTDGKTLGDYVYNQYVSSLSGYKLTIAELGKQLDEAVVAGDDDKIEELYKKLNEVRELKNQDLDETKYVIDPTTMQRTLTIENEKVVDFSPGEGLENAEQISLEEETKRKVKQLEESTLTRDELKAGWVETHLAHDQFMDEWEGEKREFRIIATEGIMRAQGTKGFPYKYYTKKVKASTHTGYELRHYVMATDAEARANPYIFQYLGSSKGGEGDINHNSRMEYGINLKSQERAYDQIYGQNESVITTKKSNFVTSAWAELNRSFDGKHYDFQHGIKDFEYRQTVADVYRDNNISLTNKELAHVSQTGWEMSGDAVGSLPKVVLDFAIANKALSVMKVTKYFNTLRTYLTRSRYAVPGFKPMTKSKLVNKIKNVSKTKTVKKDKAWEEVIFTYKGLKHNSPAAIAKYLDDVGGSIKSASIVNRGKAHILGMLQEGIKMHLAMGGGGLTSQMGLGRDPYEEEGFGTFATGVGFGFFNGIIPWTKAFTKLGGSKAGLGKGIYDYTVATPVNFLAGSTMGGFANALAEDFMGNKTWNNFLEEHYGDSDEVTKHIITELITGFAMRMGHFTKFDFMSEGRLQKFKDNKRDEKAELYEGKWVEEKITREKDPTTEDIIDTPKGKVVKKDPVEEVNIRRRYEYDRNELGEIVLKKDKTIENVEKLDDLIELVDMRLHNIRDTRQYLDPIAGALKFHNDFRNTLTNDQLNRTRVRYDENQKERADVNPVEPGEKFKYDLNSDGTPKINNTKNTIYELTYNPKLLNPGLAPHELLHILHYEKFGKDIMFKSEWVNGMVEVAKTIKTPDGRSLYQAMEEAGVWKGTWDAARVKEQELFGYISEFLTNKGNYDAIVESYGFDKLADFLGNSSRIKFGLEGEFNTQKEVALWFLKYTETIKQGKSVEPLMKHLEQFVSRGQTKKQRQLREQWEALNGKSTDGTQASRVLDLKKKIVDKEKELKLHPALQQYKDKEITIEEYKEKTKKIQDDLAIMRKNLKNIPPDVVKGETKEGKVINDFARKDGKLMTEKQWNARGGGKDKVLEELYKEDGAFVKLITRGVSFPIEGRSRETWIEDVSLGVEGKGRKDKVTGEDVTTFVSKGIKGIIERFNEGKWGTLEQNESLSGWVNSEYQFRRGEIFKWYEKNPIAKPIDAPAGKGKTIGDRLIADKDFRTETFETEDLTKEWVKNKRGEFKEVFEVEGQRKVKNEIPVDKKVFEEKGGWKETILKNTPKIEVIEKMGYRDIVDYAPKFTEEMYGVKLNDAQRKRPNDIAGEKNRKSAQEFIDGSFYRNIMEESINKKGQVEMRQKLDEKGVPATRKVKNADRIADGLPQGTVKFDKGVSDLLVGRSAFPRLGTLGELYHLATPKNYTRAELKQLGFEVNPKPHAEGYWRAATGPGGRIYIKGKAKGEKLTGENVKEFVGKKKDGSYKTLKEDRSLGGKIRRIISEEGRHISEQTMTESMDLTANMIVNLKGGKSNSFFSKVLELETAYNKGKFLEQIRSKEFLKAYLNNMTREKDGTYTIKSVKGVNNLKQALEKTIVNHFESYKNIDKEFTISKENLKKISNQLYKEFKFTARVTPEVIITKAEKAVKLPSSTAGVEGKHGLKILELQEVFDNRGDIVDGQVFDRALAKYLTEKFGVGAYEVFLQDGTSSGGGIGAFRSIKDMDAGIMHKIRYAIWRSRNINKDKRSEMDSYDMIESVYTEIAREKNTTVEKLEKYKDMTSSESYRQSDKRKLMEIVNFVKGGKFNEAKAKVEYEFGEKNKDLLKDVVEFVRESYEKGDISYRTVRQWVEMHSGNMFGLIKKSASLAVAPNLTVKELMSKFGNNPAKWVLEHTTPANNVKARIYDYILSGGEKSIKEAMDLTLRDYHTTFIPRTYDKMVNKILQSELPSAHLPGMDPLQSRYYEAAHSSNFNFGLRAFAGHRAGTVYDLHPNLSMKQKQQLGKEVGKNIKKLFPERFRKGASSLNSKNLEHLSNIDKALAEGRKSKKKKRGMSTFDFDETVGVSENYVIARRGKEVKKIASDKWPFVGDKMVKEGWKMDFTDFNRVTKGKPGPLMEKLKKQIEKFGPENVFILTARAPESAKAIHEWLKTQDVKLPLENITGLGNSTGEAKALWMLEKFAEGYNDMYFVDDALPNVKAVKDVLNQLDIKSDVQIVRSLNSKNLSLEFNKIIEESYGVETKKTYSEAKGKIEGGKVWNVPFVKGWGAEDLAGLVTYAFAGKGKKGEAHKKFFEDNLHKPFNRAYNDIHARKQNISNDYKTLRKQMPEVRKRLNEKVDGIYTVDQAIRVYLWNKAGYEVPGLSKRDLKTLVDYVGKDSQLVAFAENLSKITGLKEGYLKPETFWLGENITMDMNNVVDRVYRKEALSEFIENREVIFGKWEKGRLVGENMNKIESILGPKHREALENMIWRMEKGTNRTVGKDSNVNRWMNWMNNATGTIMFFNQKSAVLQTISTLNYVNGTFNNPLRAAQAFANQPQYWKDFAKIWNSDMMLQRRAGLKINVEASELIERVGEGKGAPSRALAYLLEKGFIPTKYADSFAIASGGATYYRNSIRKYKKQGLSEKEAEKRAWEDLTSMTEATQQSSRPDLISMQQASVLGRPILAFANTPMQMFRRHKRRVQDIANNRGNMPENIGSALYYGFAQTMIFAFLSNAMFAVDDEEISSDDPTLEKRLKHAEKQKSRYVQTIVDSYLRGMGTAGATVSAFKNGLLRFGEESKKDWNADYGNVVVDLLNVSPPIGSKARKLYSATKTWKFNKEVIPEMGLDLDNPAVMAVANVISAITNVPTDRAVMKTQNIRDAVYGDFETWQRVAMLSGFNKWILGVGEKGPGTIKVQEIKDKLKKEKIEKKKIQKEKDKEIKDQVLENKFEKEQKKERSQNKKDVTCAAVTSSGARCGIKVSGKSKYCTIHQKVETRADGKKTQCKKIKSDKSRCKMQTSAKSGYCYYHD